MTTTDGRLYVLPRDRQGAQANRAGKAGSDVSSQDSYAQTAALGVSKGVVSVIRCSASAVASEALLSAARAAARAFEAAATCPVPQAQCAGLLDKLAEVHACIVALDDGLDEQRISPGAAAEADECRIWLKHVQGFVMQQSRQVQATLSGAPSSALSAGMWRSACLDASEVLARIADELAGGASSSSDFDSPRCNKPPGAGISRIVARQSRLSYAQHWAGKVAL